jgi:hypothetical protein
LSNISIRIPALHIPAGVTRYGNASARANLVHYAVGFVLLASAMLLMNACGLSTAASAQSVTLNEPANGATVTSPVQIVATAKGGNYPISAVWIYVDNQPLYKTASASVNTTLTLTAGAHHIVPVAWNSDGQVMTASANIEVGSGTSGSGGGSGSSSSQYQKDFTATSSWVSRFSVADGALLYTPQQIDPYFSNIAAIGMTKDPNRMPQVVAWVRWYINHLNWPDKWGLYGTTYNYNVNNGVETSTDDADSTDSYAATFLTLVWNAWQTGNSSARSYISGLSYQLDTIGGVLIQTQQGDGLTWAKPDYQIKYLMDNSEAYRGLRDLASIFQSAFGDASKAAYYNAAASSMQNGILGLWMNGKWAVYKDGVGNRAAPKMGTWYADATAQVFPVMMGVVAASDARAQQSYAAFNAAWPGWPQLSYNAQDSFPWCLVGTAAAAMGDKARLGTYINSIQSKYVNSGFPWPFYNAEAGVVHAGEQLHDGEGLVEAAPQWGVKMSALSLETRRG